MTVEEFIDAVVHDGLLQHSYFEELTKEIYKVKGPAVSQGFHGLLPLEELMLLFLKGQKIFGFKENLKPTQL